MPIEMHTFPSYYFIVLIADCSETQSKYQGTFGVVLFREVLKLLKRFGASITIPKIRGVWHSSAEVLRKQVFPNTPLKTYS